MRCAVRNWAKSHHSNNVAPNSRCSVARRERQAQLRSPWSRPRRSTGALPTARWAVLESRPSSTAARSFCWSRRGADAGDDSAIALKPALHPLPQAEAFLGSGHLGLAGIAHYLRLRVAAVVLFLVSSVTREAGGNSFCRPLLVPFNATSRDPVVRSAG